MNGWESIPIPETVGGLFAALAAVLLVYLRVRKNSNSKNSSVVFSKDSVRVIVQEEIKKQQPECEKVFKLMVKPMEKELNEVKKRLQSFEENVKRSIEDTGKFLAQKIEKLGEEINGKD